MKKVLSIFCITAICLSCHQKNATTASNNNSSPKENNASTPAENDTKLTTTGAESKTVSNETEPKDDGSKKSDEIKWMSYEDAVKASKKNPKKIFLDVYTDWCGWCKKMDKSTLKDPKITSYMNKKYYAVKLDAESDKNIVYMGKKISEKELAGKVFRITGYPTTVYLESNEKLIQPIPGFLSVPDMDKILHYIGEDHYKTQTWEQFQLSYKTE